VEFKLFDLGLVDFAQSQRIQKEVFRDVFCSNTAHALILCRHYPVITLGRRALGENIKATLEELAQKNISVCQADRGGDVTYHGPGQITVYPIFNLSCIGKDINLFLRSLEQVIIDLLAEFGLSGSRYQQATGVWVRGKKICSIGIGIRHWITFHGLSFNLASDDLFNSKLIRPCGMDIQMTSLETLLNQKIDSGCIKQLMVAKFRGINNYINSQTTQEVAV